MNMSDSGKKKCRVWIIAAAAVLYLAACSPGNGTDIDITDTTNLQTRKRPSIQF